MGNQGEVNIVIKAKDEASTVVKRLGAELKDLAKNKLTQIFGLGAILAELKSVTDETLAWDQSLRNLSGAAKLTGAPLDFVKAVAERVRKEISLSKIAANDFAEELVKLAAKAGDLDLIDKNFNAIFDTLAAQGFTGEESLRALQAAVEGNERVVKKLFNLRPDEVYSRFASSIGKTADQLTAAEKAQAIFNQFAITGVKTQGQMAKALESTGEKVGDVKEALSDAKIAFGEDLRPAIEASSAVLLILIKLFSLLIKAVGAFGSIAGAVFFSVGDIVGGVVVAIEKLAEGDLDGAKKALLNIGSEVKNNFAGAIDDVKKSFGELDDQLVTFDKGAKDRANLQIKSDRDKDAALEKDKQRQKLLESELALIEERIKQGKTTNADVTKLGEIEDFIHKKLKDQRTTLDEQVKLQLLLLKVEQDRAALAIGLGHNLGATTDTSRNGATPAEQQAAIDAANRPNQSVLSGVEGRGMSPQEEAGLKAKSIGEELGGIFTQAAAGPLQAFFDKMLNGFKDGAEAAKAFGRAVVQSILNIAATAAANSLLKGIFGFAFSAGTANTKLPGLADGGIVRGAGGPREDNLLALLSNGEAVLNAKAVQAIGPGAIDYLNSLGGATATKIPRFADGGVAGAAAEGAGVNGSLTVGLADGLVLREMDSPEGQRTLIKVIAKNRHGVNGALRR